MRHRILYKLLAAMVLTFSTLLLLILLVINWSFREGFNDYLVSEDLAIAKKVAIVLGDYHQRNDSWHNLRKNPKLWRETLQQGLTTASLNYLQPHSFGDQSAGPRPPPPPPPDFDSRRPPPSHLPPRPPPPEGRAQGRDRQASLIQRLILTNMAKHNIFGPAARGTQVQWLPIKTSEQQVGWLGVLPLQFETNKLAASFINQQYRNVAIFSMFGFALTLLVSLVLARFFLRPVARISVAVGKVAAGDLKARVVVVGDDELAQLSKNFNRMTEQLAEGQRLRRQWLADISHELRTPIAVLGCQIEALIDGVRQPTREHLNSLYSDIIGLSKLVDDLHQLTLADQGTLQLELERVDLVHLCREQCQQLQLSATRQKLSLSLQNDANSAIVNADRHKLNQLLSNLLHNSIRYTDSGGVIVMSLSQTASHYLLCISDSAPSVPTQALEHIFERLYCVDTSRARTKGGSGLGLAICREIVALHKGEINAETSAQGGLKINVKLPKDQSIE